MERPILTRRTCALTVRARTHEPLVVSTGVAEAGPDVPASNPAESSMLRQEPLLSRARPLFVSNSGRATLPRASRMTTSLGRQFWLRPFAAFA